MNVPNNNSYDAKALESFAMEQNGVGNIQFGCVSGCATINVNYQLTSIPATEQVAVSVITQMRPLQPSAYFRGRVGKLEEIKTLLAGNAKLMLLNGMGGIGKTEFCRKLFHECINRKLPEVKKIGWIVFHESIEQTFFQQFTEINFQTENLAEYLSQAVRYLDSQEGGLLLFIDNANELSEKDAAVLAQLSCKVVLTSRRRSIERLQAIEIGKLSIEDCRILYRQHSEESPCADDYNYGVTYTEDDSPDEDLDAIILMADRHTLAIELLAKTQKSAAYTTQQMRKTLVETGFSLSSISESVTYVHTPEASEWDNSEQIFIEQFSKVLDISGVRNEKLRILKLFSLLSSDTISADNVRSWFDINDLDAVNALVSQGWVFRGRVGEQLETVFSMHPLINSVVRHKAMPDFITAAPLAVGLAEVLSYDDTDLFTNRIQYLGHAISLAEAIIGEYDEYPDLINSISVILNQTADYDRALDLLGKAKEICESVEDINPSITSSVYHNMAGCYQRKGDLAKAKEWYGRSIEIRSENPDVADFQMGTSYDCLGGVYEMLGDYEEALRLMECGLKIRRTALGDGHPQVAISYNNIGCVYDDLGKYQNALEMHKKALTIQLEMLNENHPDTAATYSNIGRIYERFFDMKNALKYYEMALTAGAAVLGHEHPDVLTARDSIAGVHLEKGEYKLAEEQFAEILQVRLKVLGDNHLDTATNYNNLGHAYYYQAQLDNALDMFHKALEIDKRILGNRHPDVSAILKNIADVYSEIEDMQNDALALYKDVLEIQIETFGNNHPNVAIAYCNLGEQYAEAGNYEEAMGYYAKALHIQETTVGRQHPNTAGTLYNIGFAYSEKGELSVALEHYMEAYKNVARGYGEDMPELATMSDGIAHANDGLRNYAESNKWFENAIRLYEKFFGDVNLQMSVTHYLYADSLERQGRDKDALAQFIKARDIQLAYYEPSHYVIKKTEFRVVALENKLAD